MVFPLCYTRRTFLAADVCASFARWQQGEGLWLGWVLCFYCPLGCADASIHRYHCCSVLMGPKDVPGDFFYHPLWRLPVPRRARALPVCDVSSQNAFKALL